MIYAFRLSQEEVTEKWVRPQVSQYPVLKSCQQRVCMAKWKKKWMYGVSALRYTL